MPPRNAIRDIRYYESDSEDVDGQPAFQQVGTIFQFPKSIFAISNRISEKLREYGFVMGKFHHLYVTYTSALPHHKWRLTSQTFANWVRFVDYGTDPAVIRKMDRVEQEAVVTDSTFEILLSLCNGDAEKLELVRKVRRELGKFGAALEIRHQIKETKSYRVTISFQISTYPKPSPGWIEFCDKGTMTTSKCRFVELEFCEDIRAIVGIIAVSNGVIYLKPRKSLRARFLKKLYKMPIAIPIEKLTSTTGISATHGNRKMRDHRLGFRLPKKSLVRDIRLHRARDHIANAAALRDAAANVAA